MRIFVLIMMLTMSSAIYAESKPVDLLAKLDVQGNAPELPPQTTVPYPKINVNQIFEIFLRAVDIGQMQLFDQILTRDMLQPIQVEYIYTQEDPYPIVKVFSMLQKPLSLPAMPDVYVMGISGVMDLNGNIIESIAHCDIEE